MSAAPGPRPRWRAVLTLARQESRSSWRRLLLFMSSISIGVAALVAIDSYATNVTDAVRAQSRALLGGDLAITSRAGFDSDGTRLLDSLHAAGATVGRKTEFLSMAVSPRTERTRLVQVEAVTPGVPFYGEIETEPAGAWPRLTAGANALVDPALLIALDARVGDSLQLGRSRFRIDGVVTSVPGDVEIANALGPRVFIAARWLASTGLLQFGSRAEYTALLRLPPGTDAAATVRAIRPTLQSLHLRARTVADTERELTSAAEQLRRFLGLVGLVALLLGGIGVASAIHAYVAEKIPTVAILRCVGASSAQVLGIYLVEAAALGLAGAFAGVVLGLVVQLALPHVLGGFIPVDVHARPALGAVLGGLAVGGWVAVMFALQPLLAVRRISPLEALRVRSDDVRRRRAWRDVARVGAGAALAASIVAVSVLRAQSVLEGLVMSAALFTALAVLWVSAALVSTLARRALRARWPFVVRQGVANLHRPANQTRAVVLALGFGAFLLSTLYLVHDNLLERFSLAAAATNANIAFIDVQPDQVATLDSLLRTTGHSVLQRVPIVPMRIAAIAGRDTSRDRERPRWAMRREYRSTYRDSLTNSERLIAGAWPPQERDSGVSAVSMESGVAADLGVSVGDTITWDVQGVRVPTVVRSLREVEWARFEPNFFAVFQPRALAGAPQTFVMLTHADDALDRARLQHTAATTLPNVTSIDLTLIQRTLGKILNRVSVAVRFMALFSVATGIIVLVGAVMASRRQRMREAVLLKTLGATRSQIGRVMLAEYGVLGALGSATGMVLSLGGAWGVMHFIFDAPFRPAIPQMLLLALAMMALTTAIGLLGGRDVFRATAMAALREV